MQNRYFKNISQFLSVLMFVPMLAACTDAKVRVALKNLLGKTSSKPYLHLAQYSASDSSINLNGCYDLKITSFSANGDLLTTANTVPFTLEPGAGHLLYSDSNCTAALSTPYTGTIASGNTQILAGYIKPSSLGAFTFKISNTDANYQSETAFSYTVAQPIIRVVGLPDLLYPNTCYEFKVGLFEANGTKSMTVPTLNSIHYKINPSAGQFYMTMSCSVGSELDLYSTAKTIYPDTDSGITYYYKTPASFSNISFDLIWDSGFSASAEDISLSKATIGAAIPLNAVPSFPSGSSVAVGYCTPMKLTLVNKDSIQVPTASQLAVSLNSSGFLGTFYSQKNCQTSDIIDSINFSQGSSTQYVYVKAFQESGTAVINTNINVTNSTAASAQFNVVKYLSSTEPWINILGLPAWKKGSYIGSHELPVTLNIETSESITCQEYYAGVWNPCSNFSGNSLTINESNWQHSFKLTGSKSGNYKDFYFQLADVYQRNTNSDTFKIFHCDQILSGVINESNLNINQVNCLQAGTTLTLYNPIQFNSGSPYSGIIGKSDAPALVYLNNASTDSIQFQIPSGFSYHPLSNLNINSNSTNMFANHIYISGTSAGGTVYLSDLTITSNNNARSAIEIYDLSGSVYANRITVTKNSSQFYNSAAVGIYGVGYFRMNNLNIVADSAADANGIIISDTISRGSNVQEFSNIYYIGNNYALRMENNYFYNNSIYSSQFLSFSNYSSSTVPLIYGDNLQFYGIGFVSSRFVNVGNASTVNYNAEMPGFISSLFYIENQSPSVIQQNAISSNTSLQGNHFYKNSGSSTATAIDGNGIGSGGFTLYGAYSNLYCKSPTATGSWGEFLTMGSYPTLLGGGFSLSTTTNIEGFCEVANP